MITAEALGRTLGLAPDPEMARLAFSRIGERPVGRAMLGREDILPRAALLLGFSTAASDFFAAHPEELEALAEVRPRGRADLFTECREDAARYGVESGLRRFRRRASYRVAARDLDGAPVDEVMLELTAIAEACLSTASSLGETDVALAVVGMGKLGGQELNYSSDVDVLFVHGETATDPEPASRAALRMIDLLSRPTAEGIALRVDANLRPEGRSGSLSRSLRSMLEHYRRHAETWELQALLKARPVAGDDELGRAFVEGIRPFVYPDVLDPAAIEDVRTSKARLERHVRALGKERVELKRGRGGIRDVEFAVQLLQLVHGRRDPSLRVASTLAALSALADGGYVDPADAEALAGSYRFLRRLEHRLQMVRDLQTHDLPPDRRALGPLARSLGLGDAGHLQAEFAGHTDLVRALHERLFYRPLLEAFGSQSARAPRPGVDRAASEELLAGLRFADPPGAYDAFARVLDAGSRLGTVLRAQFPVVAPALASAAAPDTALVRFERVTGAIAAGGDGFADRLAGRPDAARRLAALLAASSAFSDALVTRPALASALLEPPSSDATLFPLEPRAELIRVAGAYAAGDVIVPAVGRLLTGVADAVVARAVERARPPVPLAVIGMGRLGAEELSFGSDLDVLFVYDGEGPDDFEAAGQAAERVLGAVRAQGWNADADLRPEGRSGALGRSMASYLEYWGRWAETWEYQALLRARFVAGDQQLGARFLSNARDFAYPERLTVEQVVAIRRMRVRMEEERVRPRDARRFHFKLGYGSLADVQFAVELALMRHGFGRPEVRTANTLDAVEALAAARLLEDSVARSLADGWMFLTEVKNALEIERRVGVAALPGGPEDLNALARRLGFEEGARTAFLAQYRRVTRMVRGAMERVFYPKDEA